MSFTDHWLGSPKPLNITSAISKLINRLRRHPVAVRPLQMALIALIFALSFTAQVNAEELRYEAVWSSGTGSNIVTEPLTRSAFLERGGQLTADGLRLIDVETAVLNGDRIYTGLWVGGSGSNFFDGPMSRPAFNQVRQQRQRQGLRLVDFEVFRDGDGNRRFLGVWRSGSGAESLTLPRNEEDFIALGKELTSEGLRLVDVEIERIQGELRYNGLWREGTGANLFTPPRRIAAFRNLRDQMVADGLELVDVEKVGRGSLAGYVGVWASGNGESRLSRARSFSSFTDFGEQQTAEGMRTQDLEIFRVATTSPPPGGGSGPNGNASVEDLPDLPAWIQLSGDARLIVDFGSTIDGNPRVTLPVDFLPDFLPTKNGEQVIPDNFCGFNVRKADSFFWQTQANQVVTDFPYNAVEEVSDLGSDAFLGGLEFTGPIGQCAGENEPWQFFQPLTQTGGDSPTPNLKLVVQLTQGSEIEFLNFNIHAGEPLDARELFSDEVFKKIEAIAEAFESLGEDNGYCSIDNYVQKICKEEEEGDAPVGSCPVSDDFSSPC